MYRTEETQGLCILHSYCWGAPEELFSRPASYASHLVLVSLLPAFPVLVIPEALRKVFIATFCDLVKARTEKSFSSSLHIGYARMQSEKGLVLCA